MPQLSIIIPAYNEENYLPKTLHALKNQTYQNFETIVVANGCTDNTFSIAQKRATKAINLPQANVSLARHTGAQNAMGQTLLFLDADTVLPQNALHKIHHSLKRNTSSATLLGKPDTKQLDHKAFLKAKNLLLRLNLYHGFSGILITPKEFYNQTTGYNPTLTIREHHALNSQLQQHGPHQVIKIHAINSMRRLENWGTLKYLAFWCKTALLGKRKYETVR